MTALGSAEDNDELKASLLAGSAEEPLGATNASDAAQAFRNAGSLGSSLFVTACLGLVVQFLYQDLLGTAKAGRVAAAESLSILALGLLSFGVDTYARKEVALERRSAKTFVSGVVVFRALCTAVVVAIIAVVLAMFGRPAGVIVLFVLFGASRFLVQSNELLLACLQAIGKVSGVARINVAAKIIWAFLVLVGVSRVGPVAVPAGWVVAESIRCVLLAVRAHRHLGVLAVPVKRSTHMVLRASFPFTAGAIVSNWSTYFDVTLISFWFNDVEVGLYRYAQNIAGLSFLAGTVLPWVLMPLASRARERSLEDFTVVVRRGLQIVMTIAIPGALLLSLNADTIVSTLGAEWARAIPALRILSFTLLATYVIMATMTYLVVEGRAWLTVRIGLYGVIIDIVLNIALLHWGRRRFGVGGAGTTAAAIAVFAELIVAGLCLRSLGRSAWDKRSVSALLRVVGCGIVVVGVDRVLAGKGFSWPRLATDAVVYVCLLALSGAIKLNELKEISMKQAPT